MKTLTALLALAGVAGVGYYVYKKMSDQKEEETASYTEYTEKRSAGDKVRRASMYAVGTIKTTADKISEGIKQVKSEDMVKKGEETVEQMKETAGGIKEQVKETAGDIKEHVKETAGGIKEQVKETAGGVKDNIKELKNLVTSINTAPAEAQAYDDEIAFKDPDDEIPSLDFAGNNDSEDETDIFAASDKDEEQL